MGDSIHVEIADVAVRVRLKKRLEDGGARFVVKADDGRKWLVDVSRFGEVDEITLADIETPDWLGGALDRAVVV